MTYDLLEKELKDLPEASIADVIEYVQFLKFKLKNEKETVAAPITERIHSKRKLGVLKGKFVMAEDFDETPDCFKFALR